MSYQRLLSDGSRTEEVGQGLGPSICVSNAESSTEKDEIESNPETKREASDLSNPLLDRSNTDREESFGGNQSQSEADVRESKQARDSHLPQTDSLSHSYQPPSPLLPRSSNPVIQMSPAATDLGAPQTHDRPQSPNRGEADPPEGLEEYKSISTQQEGKVRRSPPPPPPGPPPPQPQHRIPPPPSHPPPPDQPNVFLLSPAPLSPSEAIHSPPPLPHPPSPLPLRKPFPPPPSCPPPPNQPNIFNIVDQPQPLDPSPPPQPPPRQEQAHQRRDQQEDHPDFAYAPPHEVEGPPPPPIVRLSLFDRFLQYNNPVAPIPSGRRCLTLSAFVLVIILWAVSLPLMIISAVEGASAPLTLVGLAVFFISLASFFSVAIAPLTLPPSQREQQRIPLVEGAEGEPEGRILCEKRKRDIVHIGVVLIFVAIGGAATVGALAVIAKFNQSSLIIQIAIAIFPNLFSTALCTAIGVHRMTPTHDELIAVNRFSRRITANFIFFSSFHGLAYCLAIFIAYNKNVGVYSLCFQFAASITAVLRFLLLSSLGNLDRVAPEPEVALVEIGEDADIGMDIEEGEAQIHQGVQEEGE